MPDVRDWSWKDGKPIPSKSFHQWMEASAYTAEEAANVIVKFLESNPQSDLEHAWSFKIEKINGMWTFTEEERDRGNAQETSRE